MRKKIVAGNWKMNMNLEDGMELVKDILDGMENLKEHQEVIIAPPYIHLTAVHQLLDGQSNVKLAAQNCHQASSGAFTGEISADMLSSCGVQYVIIGHSERRQYYLEDADMLHEKVRSVLENKMVPIFCCGEPLITREAGQHFELVGNQIRNALFQFSSEEFQKMIIAYEPVWAIGTGKTASSEQAQEMHHHIRQLIASKFGEEIADQLTILYGGSCKPSNAEELFNQSEVDGGLIGGASLKAADFHGIIQHLK